NAEQKLHRGAGRGETSDAGESNPHDPFGKTTTRCLIDPRREISHLTSPLRSADKESLGQADTACDSAYAGSCPFAAGDRMLMRGVVLGASAMKPGARAIYVGHPSAAFIDEVLVNSNRLPKASTVIRSLSK